MNNTQGNLKGYDCKKCKNKGCFYTVLDGIFTAVMQGASSSFGT